MMITIIMIVLIVIMIIMIIMIIIMTITNNMYSYRHSKWPTVSGPSPTAVRSTSDR